MQNTPRKTVKVHLKKLQIVFGVAYHSGEREVPENVAVILRKRKMLIETESAPQPAVETPIAEPTPETVAPKRAKKDVSAI